MHKAADRDYVRARYVLGFISQHASDYSEAARWYRKAADQGNANAQFGLGLMYALGQGVPQDYIQAHMWLNIAASHADCEDQKKFAGTRDTIADLMTPAQIAEAQRLVREWKPLPSK